MSESTEGKRAYIGFASMGLPGDLGKSSVSGEGVEMPSGGGLMRGAMVNAG